MKNCIFICIFDNINYTMFLLLLESIFIYGNITNNIDILIYTTSDYMNLIKDSSLYNSIIKFEINDTKNSIFKTYRSILDLFTFQSITDYSRILYLTTDILIKSNINNVFDIVSDDFLYTLEEENIDYIYKNSFLLKNTICNYTDKPAFTSSILLFNNCNKIRELFAKTILYINTNYIPSECHNHISIIYNAIKSDLYDNKKMKSVAVNNDFNINSNMIIHHFSGDSSYLINKMVHMSSFFESLKQCTILSNINRTKEYIIQYLLPIINKYNEPLEGNIFMYHHTLDFYDVFLSKVKNISNIVSNTNIKNVMEIGFNSGFSALLMLLSNSTIKLTCFDLGEHLYTMPCFIKLKETFGERINIIIGDSTKTLPIHIDEKYDLIHIDGGHSIDVAESDIVNSYRLSKDKTILIMDDYNCPIINTLWNKYIIKYNIKPLSINIYDTDLHDIKYVVNKQLIE